MKYELEIDKLLRDLLYDKSWMDEEDYQEVLELTFKETGISKQKLSNDIKLGVKNGRTVEKQIELIKNAIKKQNYVK